MGIFRRKKAEVTEQLLEEVACYIDERLESEEVADYGRFDTGELLFDARPVEEMPPPSYGSVCASAPCAAPRHHSASARRSAPILGSVPSWGQASSRSLQDVLDEADETFSQMLLRLIDQRGLSDPQVYKRAGIDRKLFSKIRSNPGYQPKKQTALALALALELSLDETLDLIGRAGFTLTHASRADIIVEYFIEHECWDLLTINETLYRFDQPLIGS